MFMLPGRFRQFWRVLLPLGLTLVAIHSVWFAWRRYIYSGWLYLQLDYRGPPDPRPEGVLLVSAYFPFEKSKHSQNEYNKWLRNFLSTITTDVYFFTTPDMEDTIRDLRGDLPIIINTNYKSIYDIEPLQNRTEQIHEMHKIDREGHSHHPDLYAVWAAKPFFVNEAVHHVDDLYFRRTQEPYAGFREGSMRSRYKYVFWQDCGSFRREYPMRNWPHVEKLDAVWKDGARKTGTREEDLIFFAIWRSPHINHLHWNESSGPVDHDISQGSFFGGHPEAIHWWYRAYFTYFYHYADQGIFVGKDQTLINSVLYLYPERAIVLWHDDPEAPNFRKDGWPLGDCGDSWWHYMFWLSTPREQLQFARMHYNGESACRDTRVVAFLDPLQRMYGKSWTQKPTVPLIEDE